MVISEECKQQILKKRGKVLKTVLLITSLLLPKVETRWHSVIRKKTQHKMQCIQVTQCSFYWQSHQA